MKHYFCLFLLLILVTSCGQSKEDYLEEFKKFIVEVKQNGASYTDRQWEKKDKKLEKFTTTLYDQHVEDLTTGEKLKVKQLVFIYKFYRGTIKLVDIIRGVYKEELSAYVEEAKIPIKQEAQLLAIKFKLDPVTTALNGGEDYELLFTIDEKDLEKIRIMPSTYIIGEITDREDGIKLHTSGGNIHDLKAQGWNHFDPTKEN